MSIIGHVVTIKRVDGPLLTVQKASELSARTPPTLQAHGLKQAAAVRSPLAGVIKERPFVNSLGMKLSSPCQAHRRSFALH